MKTLLSKIKAGAKATGVALVNLAANLLYQGPR